MYIVIFCSFLTILLTYLDSRKILNGGMKWGFILVTLLAAIHYDYGNDYMAYYGVYKEISTYSSLDFLINSDFYRDAGWTVVNYYSRYLGGFFSLVAIISSFQGIVYYKTIKQHLPRNQWWFGTAVYLLVPSFYLYNFSMLRQGFVIALFLSLWPLIEKRKWWIVAPILYASSFIHGSALMLVAFAFWGFLPAKNSKSLALVYSGVLIAMYLSSTFISNISNLVFETTSAFDIYKDTYSQNEIDKRLGLGFVIYLVPLIVQLLYLGNQTVNVNESAKRLVALACLSSFFIPLAMIIPMVGRVAMYFGAYSTVAIPLAYNEIKIKSIRNLLIALYVAILLYDYYIFFNSEVWKASYSTFHTIFSVI